MALFAIAIPVVSGKTEDTIAFTKELMGSRHDDFKKSRQAMGVRERTFLQKTPMGDIVIVTLEGDNPAEAIKTFGQGDDEFTKWFVEKVKEVHGMDLTQALPEELIPVLVADSEEQI